MLKKTLKLLILPTALMLMAQQQASADGRIEELLRSSQPQKLKNWIRLAQKTDAKKNTKSPASPDLWTVNCTRLKKGKRKNICGMSQELRVIKTKQKLLSVQINQSPKKGQHTILLGLPHGLFLPAGTTLRVDKNKPLRIPIQTADANGAYAGGIINQTFLGSMKKGTILKVTFMNSKQQAITIPVSLKGFGKSYKSMEKQGK